MHNIYKLLFLFLFLFLFINYVQYTILFYIILPKFTYLIKFNFLIKSIIFYLLKNL